MTTTTSHPDTEGGVLYDDVALSATRTTSASTIEFKFSSSQLTHSTLPRRESQHHQQCSPAQLPESSATQPDRPVLPRSTPHQPDSSARAKAQAPIALHQLLLLQPAHSTLPAPSPRASSQTQRTPSHRIIKLPLPAPQRTSQNPRHSPRKSIMSTRSTISMCCSGS